MRNKTQFQKMIGEVLSLHFTVVGRALKKSVILEDFYKLITSENDELFAKRDEFYDSFNTEGSADGAWIRLVESRLDKELIGDELNANSY